MGFQNITKITVWEVVNYILFDRDIAMFDVLTFIIMFVDGINRTKPVSLCLILHWFLRSLGGIVYAFAAFIYQGQYDQWKHLQSWGSIFWYTGEILIDSYPFQKAWAVATGKPKFRILALCGFIPLVIFKIFIIGFRYLDPLYFHRDNEAAYYAKLNIFDPVAFLLSAWCDVCCCFVIVAVSQKSFKSWYKLAFKKKEKKVDDSPRDEFLDSLVLTTEVRMIICTVLAVACSTLILLKDACIPCEFGATARFISTNYVYCLYYLDYLILKYRKTTLLNSALTPPPIANAGLFSPTNARASVNVGGANNLGPLIGMGGVGGISSSASLEPNQKYRNGGMTTEDSVVYGRSVLESEQSSAIGSIYRMEEMGKRVY